MSQSAIIMSGLHRLSALLSRSIRAILGSILLFASLLLFANVVLRYLFLSPIFWAEELARYLMVWLIFLGAGELAGKEGHISVNLVTHLLSARQNRTLSRCVHLLCCCFCLVLSWYSWQHALRIRGAHQVTAAMGAPMWLAYLAIPAGSLLMSVKYGVQAVTDVERHRP